MDAPRRGGPNYSFVGFMLLAAFGTFLWKSIPLESSRPSSSDSQWQPSELDNEVPARLWQDPFKAVFEYAGSDNGRMPDLNQSSDGKSADIHPCKLKELKKAIKKEQIQQIRLIAVMLTAGPDAEFNERRRRRRYAVISGLGAAGLVPQSASSIQYCYLEKNKQVDSQNKEAEPYRYIVPYEWYIPDTTEPGADPQYAVLLLWLNETIFASEPMDRFSDIAKQIAGYQVCDQESVDTSIYILGPASSDTLMKLVQRTKGEMAAYADYLNHVKDQFTGIAIKGLHILSPIATVPNSQFAADEALQKNFEELEKRFSPQESCKEQDPSKPCVTFQRTISTDDMLTDLLAKELVKRSSWEKQNNYIALISEWDTQFGRSLPKVFKESYCKVYAQPENLRTINETENYDENKYENCKDSATTRLFEFSYLRGIDGRIKGAINEDQGITRSSSKNDGVLNGDIFNSQDKYNIRRPSGTAQFDYLRRLSGQIRTQNASLLAEGKGRIAAIGILGSDVYDKLLILRALRPQFPHALFFTTDLDAQLLHPADFRWTRNLIVASSFGLDLKRELQGNIPPFRGNYQTSIFLSTLLATKFNYPGTGQKTSAPQWEPDMSSDVTFMGQISPLLYEVGRHGAERLFPVSRAIDATLHPATPKRPEIKNTVYVFLLILLLIVVVHQVKPFSGWLVFWSVIALLFAFTLAFIAVISADGGEPLSLTQGISIWPTEFIRYAALCLSIYFISRLIFDLKANCVRISRDLLGIHERNSSSGTEQKSVLAQPSTLCDLWKSRRNWLFGGSAIAASVLSGSFAAVYFSDVDDLVWYVFFAFMIAVLIPVTLFCHKKMPWASGCIPAVILVVAGMHLTKAVGADHSWFSPLYWFVALSVWFSLVYLVYPDDYKIDSINKWMSEILQKNETEVVDGKLYWQNYCKLGQPRSRWYRVLSSWLLFMAFGSLIFNITGFPVTPCRGTLSCVLDRVLTITSVSTMLLLIFLVLDEFRLTIFWIKGLVQIKNMSWHGIPEDQHSGFGEHLKHLTHEGFKIKLIAERTEEIGRLIYYPFLIIIIVLMSRSSYFDNWGLPQGIAIVVAINILLLISAATKIRYEAEKCRRIVVKKLNEKLSYLKGVAATSAKTDSTHIQQLLEEVKGIHIGAFLPFTEQPLLRASLLLFGAIGITAGEYLSLFS